MKKRILAMVLTGCLLFTAISVQPVRGALAAESGAAMTSSLQKELTEITKAVKKKITVPKELTEFSYDMYNNAEGTEWELNWSDKAMSESLEVRCDGSGRINLYRFENSENAGFKLKLKKAELRKKAEAFLKKAVPEIAGSLSFQGEQYDRYSGQCSFSYLRKENGILMPDNGIRISVNTETGAVMEFWTYWDRGIFIPNSQTQVTKPEALKIIRKQIEMQLNYRTSVNLIDPIMSSGEAMKTKAFLVYEPDRAYLAIDAKTGVVYLEDSRTGSGGMGGEMPADTEAGVEDGGLTTEEVNKISEISGIITKEQAIESVKNNQDLLLYGGMTEIRADLNKRSKDGKPSYVWVIRMSDPREAAVDSSDVFRPYASATLDAFTGRVLSFYASVKDYGYLEKDEWKSLSRYSKEDCQTRFEAFAKKQAPDYFGKVKKTMEYDGYILGFNDKTPVYGGFRYNYDRMYQNIPYMENSIYGGVDSVTGKLYQFGADWNAAVTFEEPKNMISEDKAFQAYMGFDGFELVYEINYKKDTSGNTGKEVRLVYRTDINPTWVSPFTGKQLARDGKVYSKPVTGFTYTDLKGNRYKESIELLADMGIGFAGKLFRPDQAIKASELKTMLEQLSIYNGKGDKTLSKGNKTITRIEAARLAIRLTGLEKLAKINGIYKINASDADKVKKADTGYAALAVGFGMLKTDDKNRLNPDKALTRGEAANLIVSLLAY